MRKGIWDADLVMRGRLGGLILAIFVLCYGNAFAQGIGAGIGVEGGFLAQTQLLDMSFGGMNSATVRHAAQQSFELSGGSLVDLQRWYSPRLPNLRAVFSTQVSRDLALVWGGALGEQGTKYSIGPTGVFGLQYRRAVGRRATLSLSAYSQFGGALREQSCIGNYSDIGGVQEVNCRLAASILSPRQTLDYLWNEPPSIEASFQLTYQFRF